MVSDKKIKNMCSLGWGHFYPQGHDLNKLGRGPPGDAKYQISRLYAIWFQTRRFFMFYYISLRKTCDPRGGAIFGPRGMFSTSLVDDYKMMLNTKFKCSRPGGFRQDDF